MRSFATLLKRLRKEHYPTVRAMAYALDGDAAHLSRAMTPGGRPFDIRGCLRLAAVTGHPVDEVLRAAGKGEVADLLERLYGPPPRRLSPAASALLEAFERITDDAVRASLITVARGAAGVPGHEHEAPAPELPFEAMTAAS